VSWERSWWPPACGSTGATVEDEEDLPEASSGEESQEALMDAILALDDLYQEGKLPEDAYLQRRAELKARLERAMGI
jgi:hypothetical protein